MQVLEQEPDFQQSRRRKQSATVDLSKLDRLPPHSLEAEQGVLGCMLLEPNVAIRACADLLKRGAEVFYDLRHQMLYDKLVKMHEAKQPVDLITITQNLRDNKQLEAIGGVAYLSSLMDAVPSAANLSYYAAIVREKFKLRRVISSFTQTVASVYEFEGEVDTFLAETETVVKDLVREDQLKARRDIKDIMRASLEQAEKYHEAQGKIVGVPFADLVELNRLTLGMEPGDYVVVGGRPSAGKTSLAMNIAEDLAIVNKEPVGIFSLEMTAAALGLRLLSSQSGVPLYKIRSGRLTEADFPKITTASHRISNAPLHIDDSAGINISQLRARACEMKENHDIKLFVVDYLQLVKPTKTYKDKRHEFTEVSEGLKALAKDLGIPGVVLAQLNRDVEKRTTGKPKMSDFRECGSIEQDADIGLLMWVDEDGRVICTIGKQRNGPTCDVPLQFNKETFKFRNLSPIDDKDIPQ